MGKEGFIMMQEVPMWGTVIIHKQKICTRPNSIPKQEAGYSNPPARKGPQGPEKGV